MAHSTKSTTELRGGWAKRTIIKERRQLASCKACKKRYAIQVTITVTERWNVNAFCGKRTRTERYSQNAYAEHSCCGKRLAFRSVEGTVTDGPCDARCTEAKGHQCECSCGGENHGSGAIALG